MRPDRKKWTENELEFLRINKDMSVKDIAAILGRTELTVYKRRSLLNLVDKHQEHICFMTSEIPVQVHKLEDNTIVLLIKKKDSHRVSIEIETPGGRDLKANTKLMKVKATKYRQEPLIVIDRDIRKDIKIIFEGESNGKNS